jgi:hypothetical protein
MKFESRDFLLFKSDPKYFGVKTLLGGAAFGMTCLLISIKANEINRFVEQPIRGLNREMRDIKLVDPSCTICGQNKSAHEFASKGKGRLSRLCRDCDNKRRRVLYEPRNKRIGRSDWTISFESGDGQNNDQKGQGVSTILGLLTEYSFITTITSDTCEEHNVGHLIGRKSVIDEIT